MLSAHVLGKRITRLVQEIVDTNAGRKWHLREIQLEGGNRILFRVHECEDGYALEAVLRNALDTMVEWALVDEGDE